jgi:hypothetical protein
MMLHWFVIDASFHDDDAIAGQVSLLFWSSESSTLEEIRQEMVVLFPLLFCLQTVLGRRHGGASLVVVVVAVVSLLLLLFL